ncbi:ATP-dependent helicase [Candidatus Uhrbacteria bacterium]|nr:ATP-dependent helicase [Candidatus Uhrbacteria bacterium]
MSIDYSQELNAEQLRVVEEGDGPCLVLAGAGSGKTRTIVYRVAWLLEHGVDPREIMLVTFTNKAAKEMLTRVDALTQGKSRGLFGGTFHHLGNLFLRRSAARIGRSSAFTILDSDDSQQLMKGVVGSLGSERSKLFPKPAVLRDIWSFMRNSDADLEEYVSDRFGHLPEKEIVMIVESMRGYEKRKQSANQMDFDDLLIHWRTLLQESASSTTQPSPLRRGEGEVFHHFQYILVDEYQDTNTIQGDIVRALAKANGNLLVVGDDSQSIYSFRAATVRNILDFPKQFVNAKTFRLETNYRSTPEILHLANASIKKNRNRHEKNLKSLKQKGERPKLIVFEDTEKEAEFIANALRDARDAGAPLHEHAVLFRAAYQSLALELALAKRNIPYIMRGGIRFFEQAHVKDVLAYFRILANPLDELAWKRVLLMEEGVGDVKAARIFEIIQQRIPNSQFPIPNENQNVHWSMFNDQSLAQFGLPKNTTALLRELATSQDTLLTKGVLTILQNGYGDYLESNFENHKDRRADLEQLASFAGRYQTLEEFLSDATLSEGFRRDRAYGLSGPEDAVVLSTIHQAKGLEWDHVYVIGLVEGQFPHIKVLDHPHELEEERRLFYVAVTRAADRLTLTFSGQSKSAYAGMSVNDPSRFLAELPSDAYTRVDRHDIFDSSDDDNETIRLSESGDVINEGILDRILKEKRSSR